ncbi:MAG: hypothetical protein JJU28_09230 [Cyclobacteriaceae bacterium]|nr:hypothetical protein [Cyclobacteriaceae bacterium]
MKPEETNYTRRNQRRILFRYLYFSLGTIAVMVVFYFIIKSATENLTLRILQDLVHNQSGGLYQLNSEKIGVQLARKKMSLYNADFSLSDAAVSDTSSMLKTRESTYDAHLTELHINVESLWDVYFRKELKIVSVSAIAPHLDVFYLPDTIERTDISFRTGNLYNLISDYLNLFKVNDFELIDGSFNFIALTEKGQGVFSINNISFWFKNFLIAPESFEDEDKFLYSDDFTVSIKNQLVELPDSINVLTFDQLDVSTADSAIYIQNLRLRTRDILADKDQQSELYDVHVPILKLDGVDFLGAYHQNRLNVDRVKLESPNIITEQTPREVPVEEAAIKNRIARLANDFFEQIAVESFEVKNAQLDLLDWKKLRSRHFTFDSLDFKLSRLLIDSSNYQTNNRVYAFNSVELTIRNYHQRLADSIHAISVEIATANTATQTISAENFVLAPFRKLTGQTNENMQKNDIFHVTIPHFLLSGFDLKKILYEDTVRIQNAIFTDPDVEFYHNPGQKRRKEDTPQNIRDIYAPAEELGLSIYLGNIDLRNGKYRHFVSNREKAVVSLEGMNLQLLNLAFDSLMIHGERSRRRELLRFQIAAGNVNLYQRNKNLHFENLRYTTRGETMSIGQINLQQEPDGNNNNDKLPFQLEGASARIAGLNLPVLIYDQKIEADTLFIDLPLLSIEADPPGYSQNGRRPDLGKPILIPEDLFVRTYVAGFNTAQITHEKHTWLSISHGKVISSGINRAPDDIELNLFEGDFKIEGKSFKYNSPWDFLTLQGEEFIFSKSDSSISIQNTSLKDVFYLDNKKFELNAHLPELLIGGFDSESAIHKNQIDIDEIFTRGALVTFKPLPNDRRFNIKPKARPAKNKSDKVDDTGSFVNIKKISIEKTSIHAHDPPHINVETSIQNLHIRDIAFSTHELKLENLNIIFNNYSTNIDFLKYSDAEKSIVNIKNISFDSERDEFITGAISYYPIEKNEEQVFTIDNIYIPGIKINGLNPLNGVINKSWQFAHADLQNPEIALTLRPDKKRKTDNHKPVKTASSIKSNTISGDLNFINGKLNLALSLDSGEMKFQMDYFSLSLDDLNLSNVSQYDQQQLFFSRNSILALKNISLDLPDSLNTLSIGALDFAQEDSLMIINHICLMPRYDKMEYAIKAGKEADWINLKSSEVVLQGLDLPRLIHDAALYCRRIDIDSLYVEAFRNKQVPWPDTLFKPMPQETISQIANKFAVDQISIKNSYISYEELPVEGTKAGKIYFTDVNATIGPLTNDDSLRTIGEGYAFSTLNLKGKLMGEGNISSVMRYDMVHADQNFLMTASMGPIQLDKLEPVLLPLVFINIPSGKMESLQLRVNANRYYAVGEMRMRYHNLRVQFVNQQNYESSGMGPALMTFFANTFVIRKNNNRALLVRKGDVFFERDETRSIFNYWTKIILSGVVSSVGAKNHRKELKQIQDQRIENITAEP